MTGKKKQDWLTKIAEKRPFEIFAQVYPSVREKFGIPEQPTSRTQFAVALDWMVKELQLRGIPASAPPYPCSTVQIPIKYYNANKWRILDILDEITGIKHMRQPPKNFQWYSISELKRMCKDRGLSTEGSKETLIRRLR